MLTNHSYNFVKQNPAFKGIIGVAEIDITPPVGIYTKNWGASKTTSATGIHRNLMLSCITFQSTKSDHPLVLLTADLGWWKSMGDENFVRNKILEELNIKKEHLLFCLSHTHSGPGLYREDNNREAGSMINNYLINLQKKSIEVIRKALSLAEESVLTWAYGKCNLAANRDFYHKETNKYLVGLNTDSPADDTLLVGRVTTIHNKVVAVLVNYACHPTTLGWQNTLISPDYVGAMREVIKKETGAICLFLQGASGELAPAVQYTGDVMIADKHGRTLGYSVLSTLVMMNAPSFGLHLCEVVESGAPLAVWCEQQYKVSSELKCITVPIHYNLKEQWSLDSLYKDYKNAESTVLRERLLRKINICKFLGGENTTEVPLWIWQLGDAILIGHPNEAYSIFQQEIRNSFPSKAVVVMNVANGHIGYLPPQNLYQHDIYSVWQTPFDKGSLEHLIRSAKQSIQELL